MVSQVLVLTHYLGHRAKDLFADVWISAKFATTVYDSKKIKPCIQIKSMTDIPPIMLTKIIAFYPKQIFDLQRLLLKYT
jgi:hypothetical protein